MQYSPTMSATLSPRRPQELSNCSATLPELAELAELAKGIQKKGGMTESIISGNLPSSTGPLFEMLPDEVRDWEQRRLAQELENLPKLSPSQSYAPAALSPSNITASQPWSYEYSETFVNTDVEKRDTEEKLTLKYRELTELKSDQERVERGIVRCRQEIDVLIEKMAKLQSRK